MNNTSQPFFINSADRLSGTANDFYVNLDDINNDFSQNSITIQELCIPMSMYPINSNNNVIAFTGVSGSWNATLTPANYTPTSLITELVTRVGTTGSLGITGGITGAYNSATSRFSFTNLGGTDFTITTTAYNGKYLGLSAGAHTSVGNVISSDVNINLAGALQIRVLTDLPIETTNTRNTNRDVLCSVFPDATFGGVITKNLTNFSYIKMSSPTIGMTRFRLVDELNQDIDLNGLEWSMTLLKSDITDK